MRTQACICSSQFIFIEIQLLMNKIRIKQPAYCYCLPVFLWLIGMNLCDKTVGDADPCEESKAGLAKLSILTVSAVFTHSKNKLKELGKDGREYGLVFGKDTAGNITASAARTSGLKNASSSDTDFPGAFADMHNHPGNTVPSAGDLYSLISINRRQASFDTRITVLGNGCAYAIMIFDPILAANFADRYPPEQTSGFSPRFPDKLFLEFAELKSYFINIMGTERTMADEMATAYILDRYSTGVALLRSNAAGKFSRVFVTGESDAGTDKKYLLKLCDDSIRSEAAGRN